MHSTAAMHGAWLHARAALRIQQPCSCTCILLVLAASSALLAAWQAQSAALLWRRVPAEQHWQGHDHHPYSACLLQGDVLVAEMLHKFLKAPGGQEQLLACFIHRVAGVKETVTRLRRCACLCS